MKTRMSSLILVTLLTLSMVGCSSHKDVKPTNNISPTVSNNPTMSTTNSNPPTVSNSPTMSATNSISPTETTTPEVKIVEVISPQYSMADNFYDGLAIVGTDDYKYGFIDKTGKEVIPIKYDYVRPFSEGFAPVDYIVDQDDSWTFIDKTGKEITTTKYNEVESFSDGMAAVSLNYKWGFIDISGKEVIPLQYDEISSFSDGVAVVRIRNENTSLAYQWSCAVIDKTGKEIVPTGKYTYIDNFSEGLAAVAITDENSTKIGFIDKTGKEVIPLSAKYSNALPFVDGMSVVVKMDSNDYGFINKKGTEVISTKYSSVRETGLFSDGLAVVDKDVENSLVQVVIDKTGKEIINTTKYAAIRSFSDGVAIAVNADNNSWVAIDKTGKEIVPADKYSIIYDFHEGYAIVMSKEDYAVGVIDTTGTEVVPVGKYKITGSLLDRGSTEYDNFNYIDGWAVSNGMILIKVDNQYGYIYIEK